MKTPSSTADVVLYELTCLVRAPFLMAMACYLLEPLWSKLVAWADVSDPVMFTAASGILHGFMWLACNFVFMDLGDNNGWFSVFKLPRTRRMEPSKSLIRQTILEAVGNQLFTTPVVIYFGVSSLVALPPQTPSTKPSLFTLYLYFVGCTVWNSWAFYFSHRLLHEVPFLYRTIHKKHHRYIGSVSAAAEFAHPIEDVLSAFVPTLGFALYFRIPMLAWLVWLAVRAQETYESHSGFCFEGSRLAKIGLLNSVRARHHDWHHTVNQGHYGFVFQDWMCGTMGPWLGKRKTAHELESSHE